MKKYSIGLDIGTNSVGWAVVDENNDIVKKNGKALWGVRMFEEAHDASERRSYRGSRRRLKRRNERIALLREIFKEEINKVDPKFFERLDDSFFKREDKRNNNLHTLFNDEALSDKEYFKRFPTIYHLRKYLMDSKQKEDVRFLYLALHHMIKYRGNFLYEGDAATLSTNDSKRVEDFFNKLNKKLKESAPQFEEKSKSLQVISLSEDKYRRLKEILIGNLGKTDKKNELRRLFSTSEEELPKNSFVVETVIPLLVGSKVNINKSSLVKDEGNEQSSVCVLDDSFEEDMAEAIKKNPQIADLLEFLMSIKEVVSYYYLQKILGDSQYISDAMINIYNNHRADLAGLKKFIKKYLPNEYNNCFKNIEIKNNSKKIEIKNNYVNYIGMGMVKNRLVRIKHCSREEFYKYVRGLIGQIDADEAQDEKKSILEKIDSDNYLLRQNSNQNGAFPKQLNEVEMNVILDNQKKYYSFLTDDAINKIKMIFNFKIPYYVGPLNPKSSKAWIKRQEGKIYPWNFEEMVDLEASAEEFINRMKSSCSYLRGEFCLPKDSMIFQKYNCLQYLNKLNINDYPIDVTVKQRIFNEVFLRDEKVYKKNIRKWVTNNLGVDAKVTTSNGKDLEEVTCSMSTYYYFKNKLGGEDVLSRHFDEMEDIVNDIVLFEDKKILEKRLLKKTFLSAEQIKKIKDLNFKGYANLSRKFLADKLIMDPDTGELFSVLDILWDTNLNLQQILFDERYNYQDIINKINASFNVQMDYREFIDEYLYVSPIMKRSLIQAYQIIKEVERIIGRPLDKYYVECTRSNAQLKGDKGRKDSRFKNLNDIYKKAKDLVSDSLASKGDSLVSKAEIADLQKELNDAADKDQLKINDVYLYFTQLGRDMYTLEKLDLNKIKKEYNHDHIYPQSIIKDDSVHNNLVLTSAAKNNAKSDKFIYEIPGFLPKDAEKFYGFLNKIKLITAEKYRRLTKKTFSPAELDTFVNRQLVATNQSVKGLIELLKKYDGVKASDIIYSKAENISAYRRTYDLVKSREANNYHHAHDAYLNVVIGRIIHDYFIKNKFSAFKDVARLQHEGQTTNVDKILERAAGKGSALLEKITKNLYERFDIMETTRAYFGNELMSKVSIKPAGKGFPVSESDCRKDIEKYGGFEAPSYGRLLIVKVKAKDDKTEYYLEGIPNIYKNRINQYLDTKFTNYKIVSSDLKINTIIEEDAKKYCITGKTGDSFVIKNLKDRNFDYASIVTIRKIEKYFNKINENRRWLVKNDCIILSGSADSNGRMITLERDEVEKLYQTLLKLLRKPIYDYLPIRKNINEFPNNLNNFSIEKAAEIIKETLQIMKTNERKSPNFKDLKKSNGKKLSLYFLRSRKLTSGMKFIAESPTGYYRKVLFEVK